MRPDAKDVGIAELAVLLSEAVRMYEEYALLAIPHPGFRQGRWVNNARETLERLGYPVPPPSAQAQAMAIQVLSRHYNEHGS